MDSGESKLDALLTQCKSNDVDVKIDALTKIQIEAEQGLEINDPDALISVLKTCLRTPNQHLTTATLSALPTLLPLLVSRPLNAPLPRNGQSSAHSSTSSSSPSSLVDAYSLRQVLNALLPTGGLFERLGDKEKAQMKAREALVMLGGFAFRAPGPPIATTSTGSRGNKGPETPLMIYERFLRENGLSSKVWKAREQSILTLVHIRRQHHMFPLRPFLSLLVDCLEDTDAHVRDCARQSIIELFSGPSVTDAARADLKKEMTKKGVRKTIVDSVLSKLLSGGNGVDSGPQSPSGSENGDAKPGGYVPPSLALQGRKASGAPAPLPRSLSQSGIGRPPSRAAAPELLASPTTEAPSEVKPVYIASIRDLENEFQGMEKAFEGKETEHNWSTREQAVLRVRGMLKGEVHQKYFDSFMACLKQGFIQWSLKALASLRTTVCTNTCVLYHELAAALGTSIDPFCDILLTNLLKMAGFTKKLTADRSQASVTSLITSSSGTPRIFISLITQTLKEKNIQARNFAIGHLKAYIEVHGHRSRNAIEAYGGVDILEGAIKKSLGDPNAGVKAIARAAFWSFNEVWRERGVLILEGLTPVARKEVEKVCPNPELVSSLPPTTPKTAKKSSVAAAIAASRAKAKAIATAPPSLRHQATSASHAAPSRRPISPSLSKSTSQSPPSRPSSPLRTSTSPSQSPPRSRIISNAMTRSVSAAAVTPPTSRSVPRADSPPSPMSDGHSRRLSSPLASGASLTQPSTLRKAMQTTLPASPPSPNGSPPRRPVSRILPASAAAAARMSSLMPTLNGVDEDSLLLATAIPLPDGDSESEHSINLMSFSAPYEMYPPPPASNSQTHSISPKSAEFKPMIGVSNALSTDSVTELAQAGGAPVVEDALKARAEQAESAAERLLELVEPEDGVPHPMLPPSLLVGSGVSSGVSTPGKSKSPPANLARIPPPVTPVNRASIVMRQAALFQDSPAYNGKAPSLLDALQNRSKETGWWLKRKNLLEQRSTLGITESSNAEQDLETSMSALETKDADIFTLQKLVFLIMDNPSNDVLSPLSPDSLYPLSPSPFASSGSVPVLHRDMWEKNKNLERLFSALGDYMLSTENDSQLEYGLMIVWQLLESQLTHLEGREGDVFTLLLRVRYCNKFNVLEATNTIRDVLTARIEAVYGLTTLHASLRAFHAEAPPSEDDLECKAASYAFGLIALGKFILRLPAEIAEEELPRLRDTLITGLNDSKSLVVREAAAAAIISAQLVLRDETHLFVLLDGLADEKKNLLTYLFEKHGARGLSHSLGRTGMDKLEKEMRRLDTRTSTPPRRPG
ncbi:clasp N terminal-domain-containing protein [Lentinula raphanica]|uniref:Clasp N terminal-domain-containing protein n=1 Tax=Lentinula raphanica TaxID=153919 RepID=A0AA38UC97_9AGAR|nr:clasp N terminal-domain-containing protein [Lentinula raphanica]KAJ3836954.1 clasp N terminal-domain-containing protein [Lentinula raphanica]